MARITISHNQGKKYVAKLVGTDEKYTFVREFLKLVPTGNRYNNYIEYTTIEDVPGGTLIEKQTGNYKGKLTRTIGRVVDDGVEEISSLDAIMALSGADR